MTPGISASQVALPAVVQVVGYKNAGKTTLVCKLVEALTARSVEVGTVKHDAHRFEIDHEGKDTWRHRQAGARVVAISSEQEGRTCYIEQRYTPLGEMLDRMAASMPLEAILVEGFKSEAYPKIAIVRTPDQLELLGRVAPLLAVATWLPAADVSAALAAAGLSAPVHGINDVDGLTARVLGLLGRQRV